MSIALIIYFISLVDNVVIFSTILSIILGIISSISFVMKLAGEVELSKNQLLKEDEALFKIANNLFRKIFPLFIISSLLGMFTPDSKTIASMYLVPKLVENQQLQAIPDKAMNVLNGYLEKWADDLMKDEHEEK